MKIIATPDARLREKSEKVREIDDEIRGIIADMRKLSLDWEKEHPYELSAAMAAPQMGVLKRIIIIRDNMDDKEKATFTALINPEIIRADGKIVKDYEGCLSVPSIYYIMEHFDDYFTNDNSPSNGRLKTRIGDKVVIGKDFAEVLGLEEGSMYSIGDREGFLSENPGKNNSFVLQETDDPDNPGNRVEVGSKIKEVYVVPRLFIKHLSGGKERKIVRNEIRFVDINGNDYAIKKKKHEVIWKTGNEVQPELDKLNRELNLTRGSMVQIMKRETKEGKNTETEEGDIIYGRLLTNGVDSNGFQIMVDGKEWTTTGINGICREWKTYYIGTEDSVYEIIPVEPKSS